MYLFLVAKVVIFMTNMEDLGAVNNVYKMCKYLSLVIKCIGLLFRETLSAFKGLLAKLASPKFYSIA